MAAEAALCACISDLERPIDYIRDFVMDIASDLEVDPPLILAWMECLFGSAEIFTDGVRREVYQPPNLRYILDDHGEPIYGVWYIPRCDEMPEPDAVVRAMEGQP